MQNTWGKQSPRLPKIVSDVTVWRLCKADEGKDRAVKYTVERMKPIGY